MKRMSVRRSHHQQGKYERLLDVGKIESDGNVTINDRSLRSSNIEEPSELPPSSQVLPPQSPSIPLEVPPSSRVLPSLSSPIPGNSTVKPSSRVMKSYPSFGFFDGFDKRNGNMTINDDQLSRSSNIEEPSKLPPPSPVRKLIMKPIGRDIKSHALFGLFDGRNERKGNTSIDDQLLHSPNIEERSKLSPPSPVRPPPSPANPRKSPVKPIGKVIKSHPLFGFFDGSSKRKTVAKPDFGRYLEYVKEGGAWDPNSNKPVMFYK